MGLFDNAAENARQITNLVASAHQNTISQLKMAHGLLHDKATTPTAVLAALGADGAAKLAYLNAHAAAANEAQPGCSVLLDAS